MFADCFVKYRSIFAATSVATPLPPTHAAVKVVQSLNFISSLSIFNNTYLHQGNFEQIGGAYVYFRFSSDKCVNISLLNTLHGAK